MRRFASVAFAAALCWAGLLAGGIKDFPTLEKAEFEAKDLEKGTLSITRKDVDVTLKGRLRNDFIFYDKIYTLRRDNDDQLSFFRTKAHLDFAATYGKQTHGRSAADAFIRLTSYGYWRYEGRYTPFYDYGTHAVSDVKPLSMLTFLDEAWINLHFGTFFHPFDNWYSYEDHPVSVKIGLFPYQLGRGVALGDSAMHIPYLGWDSFGHDDCRDQNPGILIHGYINKSTSYDLYYSKRNENSAVFGQTWETIHSNRTDGRRQWRGVSKDRDLFVARMDFNHSKRWGDLHVQPYGMYLDAPELRIETLADSSARLGTVGLMADYKKGRFSMNVEVAAQFGHQNVYAIDRNVVVEDTNSSGARYDYFSHIFDTNGYSETKGIATPALVVMADELANRGGCFPAAEGCCAWVNAVTKNGDQIVNDTGSGQSIYNSNVKGNERFRPEYRNCHRGFMGLADVQYEFEKVPVKVAAACAYISGDKHPFNEERDKRYKAFLPYGDYNYVGKYVFSQVVLDARKLPRPVDICYRHQYAHNNVKDMSNLAYFGLGTTWHPFENKNKLMLRTNLLWFWETATLKRWDKQATLPGTFYGEGWEAGLFYGDDSWNHCDGVWTKSGECDDPCRHNVGWKTCDDASKVLGTELNFEAQYRPVANCIFLAQLGVFIPGQLYKDLDGQPNVNTHTSPKAAEGVYGLGSDSVWRVALSLDYRF